MGPRELALKARASPELLDLILANRTDCAYVVDSDYHFAVLYSNSQFSPRHTRGKPCYESIIGRNSPCDFCPVTKNIASQHLQTNAFSCGEQQYEVQNLPVK